MSASKSLSLKEQAQTSSGGKKRNITSDLLHFKFVSLNEGRHKENYLEKKPLKNTESTFQNVNDTLSPPELDNGNSCLELSTAAALEAKFIKNQLLKLKCSFQLFCAGSLVFNTEPFPLTEVPSSFPIFFTNGQHPPLTYFNKKTVPPTTSCCLLLKPGKEIAAMMVENIVPGNYLLTELPPSTKTPGLGQAKGMRYDVVCATLTPYYFSVKDLWKGGRVLKLRHFTEKEHPQCLLPALRFDDRWFVDTDNIHDWLAACYPQCTHELYPLLHAASQSLIYRGRSRQNKKFNFRVQILSRRARKRKGRSIDGSSASHESVLDGFQ